MGSKIWKEGLSCQASKLQAVIADPLTPFPPMFNVGNLVANLFLGTDFPRKR